MFTYKARKHAAKLFTAYQSIADKSEHFITTAQLMACIRLVTDCVEKIFNGLEDLIDFSEVLTDITRDDLTTEDVLKSIEDYSLRGQEEKANVKEAKQSALLNQFGLMKQKMDTAPLAGVSQPVEDKKQAITEAIKRLRGLYQQNAACYIQAIESTLPVSIESRQTTLTKLMPEVSRVLSVHMQTVVADIDLRMFHEHTLKVTS